MTDGGIQLLAALAFFFALAAFGVACALWWRLNRTDDRTDALDQQMATAQRDLRTTKATVRLHATGRPQQPEPEPHPEPATAPQPAVTAAPLAEPPTAPIDDVIDRELARFTFTGGRRP